MHQRLGLVEELLEEFIPGLSGLPSVLAPKGA